jgi:hypothetical protein
LSSFTRGQVAASEDAYESESENEDEIDLDEEPSEVLQGERGCEDDDISDVSDTEDCSDDEEADAGAEGISNLIRQLKWKYAPVDANADGCVLDKHMRRFYDGPEGLRPGVAETFKDPFQCFQCIGGLRYSLVARRAASSNDYFHRFKKPTLDRNQLWHGIKWMDITVEEMHKFLGILLHISMSPVDGGGYEAYFNKKNN